MWRPTPKNRKGFVIIQIQSWEWQWGVFFHASCDQNSTISIWYQNDQLITLIIFHPPLKFVTLICHIKSKNRIFIILTVMVLSHLVNKKKHTWVLQTHVCDCRKASSFGVCVWAMTRYRLYKFFFRFFFVIISLLQRGEIMILMTTGFKIQGILHHRN